MQKKYKMQKNESENMPRVSDYIEWKNQESMLEKEVKNCQRRINVAEKDNARAVKLLKKYKQLN